MTKRKAPALANHQNEARKRSRANLPEAAMRELERRNDAIVSTGHPQTRVQPPQCSQRTMAGYEEQLRRMAAELDMLRQNHEKLKENHQKLKQNIEKQKIVANKAVRLLRFVAATCGQIAMKQLLHAMFTIFARSDMAEIMKTYFNIMMTHLSAD